MHERVYDEFVEKAKARAVKRLVGDPFKGGIEQGPQVNQEHSLLSNTNTILSLKKPSNISRFATNLCLTLNIFFAYFILLTITFRRLEKEKRKNQNVKNSEFLSRT